MMALISFARYCATRREKAYIEAIEILHSLKCAHCLPSWYHNIFSTCSQWFGRLACLDLVLPAVLTAKYCALLAAGWPCILKHFRTILESDPPGHYKYVLILPIAGCNVPSCISVKRSTDDHVRELGSLHVLWHLSSHVGITTLYMIWIHASRSSQTILVIISE